MKPALIKRSPTRQIGLGFIAILLIGTIIFILFGNKCGNDINCLYQVHGIDVSRWQLDVDWQKVERTGVSFVFVKATEGKNEKDPYFKKNWDALEQTNMLRGAYHYYLPRVHSKYQAANFINTVDLKKGDLPPVLDLEETDGRSNKIIIQGVTNWLNLMEEHYGVKPIIYVNQHYYHTYIKGNFNDYVIWLAAYNRKNPPRLGFKKWSFWQYSNTGSKNGINEPVDLNVFQGSIEELRALTKKK